jgi:hypothetical protein
MRSERGGKGGRGCDAKGVARGCFIFFCCSVFPLPLSSFEHEPVGAGYHELRVQRRSPCTMLRVKLQQSNFCCSILTMLRVKLQQSNFCCSLLCKGMIQTRLLLVALPPLEAAGFCYIFISRTYIRLHFHFKNTYSASTSGNFTRDGHTGQKRGRAKGARAYGLQRWSRSSGVC